MAKVKEINDEIQQVGILGELVDAYEEISSMRMKKTREKVLNNRGFLDEINIIFEEVKNSYVKEALSLAKKFRGKKQNFTFIAHNGKTVAVLLSANVGLYGAIVKETFRKFIDEVNQGNCEVTITGKHGLNLFLEEKPNFPYTYFNIPDIAVKSGDLYEMIRHIVQYETIHVYYGKFVNVIKQYPSMFSISAETSLDKGAKAVRSYIFEPGLEKILAFFETQIFASLFEQTVHESELAKHASRFVAMDRASTNIKDLIKRLNFNKLKSQHYEMNKKRLNNILPVLLMRGGGYYV